MGAVGNFFNPAQQAARQNTDLARQYASGANFTPYNVSSGVGQATMGPQGAQFSLSGPLANLSQQMQGVDTTATGLSPEQQQMFSQLQGIGLTGLGEATGQQYGLMKAMADPYQQQARSSMEARLASQGMLGASGGMQRMGNLLSQQAQQDLGMQQQAFGQALQGRQQDIGLFGQAMNMAEMQRQLTSPERQMQLLSQQAGGIAGIEGIPSQQLGGFAQQGFGAEQQRQQQLLQAQMAQNAAEAQTRGILPNLLLQGGSAALGGLTGGAGLFSGLGGMTGWGGGSLGQNAGLFGQTGYFGGPAGALSGAEWEQF